MRSSVSTTATASMGTMSLGALQARDLKLLGERRAALHQVRTTAPLPCGGRFVKEHLTQELKRIDQQKLGDMRTAERALLEAHARTQEALKRSGIDVSLSGRCVARGFSASAPTQHRMVIILTLPFALLQHCLHCTQTGTETPDRKCWRFSSRARQVTLASISAYACAPPSSFHAPCACADTQRSSNGGR